MWPIMAKKHSTHLIDRKDLQETSDYSWSRTKYTRIKRKTKIHTVDESTLEQQEHLIEDVNHKHPTVAELTDEISDHEEITADALDDWLHDDNI